MKRWFLVVLMIVLACASARAEGATRESVRAEKGVWSSEVYEGVEPEWLGRPYALRERLAPEQGMMIWEFPSEQDEHGWHELYSMPWLRSTGIAAECVTDFDGDGADEWVTVETRTQTGEFYAERPVLWVCVYEMDGEWVTLSDEWLVSNAPFDVVGDGMKLLFVETDGVTKLVSVNAYSIDGRWHEVWAVAYDGTEMTVTDSVEVSFDEAGGMRIVTERPADDGQEMRFEEDEELAFTLALAEAVRPMGLGVEYENGKVYGFRLQPAVTGCRMVMETDLYAHDEEGKGVVRIKRGMPVVRMAGMVNLRDEPSTEAEIVGGAQAGDCLLCTGETAVDGRGVVWYGVLHREGRAWVSSRYAVPE